MLDRFKDWLKKDTVFTISTTSHIEDFIWTPGEKIKEENNMKLYVTKFKNDPLSAHISEFEARDSYRYQRTDLKPWMSIVSGTFTEEETLAPDTAQPMVVESVPQVGELVP